MGFDAEGAKERSPDGSSDENEVEDGTKKGGLRHRFQIFRCPSTS